MDRGPDRPVVRRILVALLVPAVLALCATVMINQPPEAAEPEFPTSGEELWQSMPPELLADVIESKMEQISKLEDDIDRIRYIRESKLAVVRPPPDE